MQTYNQTRHDHEITLERATLIEPCDEDAEAAAIPDVLWNVSHFCPIMQTQKYQLRQLTGLFARHRGSRLPNADELLAS